MHNTRPKKRHQRPANKFTRLSGLERLKEETINQNVVRHPVGYVSFFEIRNADGTVDLIDTGNDPLGFKMLSVAKNGVKRVIISHHHRDHTRGLGQLPEGTKVYAHKNAIDIITRGMRSEGFLPGLEDAVRERLHVSPAAKKPDGLDFIPLNEGMLEDEGYHIFEAAGHTSDGIVVVRHGVLFAQDVLDVTRKGEIRHAFRPVTLSHTDNLRAISNLSSQLEERQIVLSAIAPAHSGTLYDPDALARFRA